MASEYIPNESVLLAPPSPSPSPKPESSSRSHSPSKSPQRLRTDPEGSRSTPDQKLRAFKRIVVFCDGTWQDGLSAQQSEYTNVLRLARTVNYEDERFTPPIHQIVYYQSGVGTEDNFHSRYVDGATGGNLAEKVEEAYAFIAHNYCPGDEIFLFGFSRGAYTARMVSMFIGEIGILDRRDMSHFADIFYNFQQLGESHGEAKAELKAKLADWRKADSRGRKRADIDDDKFTVKCLGVWDTVGALGLPKELLPISPKKARLFGFHDQYLGEHVENAFQAMALHEMRSSFDINKFIQTDASKAKKQTLKQCWFAGCHTDIGGGYKDHDLSDISLVWMAAQIEGMLSLDIDYLKSHFRPVAEWGKQQPHDSATGIFMLANKTSRTLPKDANCPQTHETFHASVLEQEKLCSAVSKLLADHPNLVAPLTELEHQIRQSWPYEPGSPSAKTYGDKVKSPQLIVRASSAASGRPTSWIEGLKSIARSVSLKGDSKRPPRTQAAGAIAVAETDESATIGIVAAATVVKPPGHVRSRSLRVA